MNKTFLFLFGASLLFACKQEEPKPLQKEAKEVNHAGEGLSEWDSTWVSGRDSLRISFALEAIPNHFVAANVETDSFVEVHVYQDKQIRIEVGKNSWIISKDSLTKDINQEYLAEALIENLNLMVFEPKADLYFFEFTVRKPLEKDAFHYQGQLLNGVLQLTIADE